MLLCVWANGNSQNIMVGDDYSPNEPTIMMDPNNPDILVAGTNLNNYYYSSDGGQTWTVNKLNSPYGVWGDPVIDVDEDGNFYFFHLSNPPDGEGDFIDRIVCQKSNDQGKSWSEGTYTGLNGNKDQDKHWSVIDRKTNHIYLTWTQFDKYGSTDPSCQSNILFSKSTDGGDSWSVPKRVSSTPGDCRDDDDTVEGAVPAIGPNGEIYVAWAGPNGLVFNRSLDQGESWLSEDIKVDDIPSGWNYKIPGIFRANGLPVTKCDLSGGPNHGTIYINWSDKRSGWADTDIWLVKSTDGGDTWSDAIRVNNDNSKRHQFFTWMDIDQTNGKLSFVFYDRRNYESNATEVYFAHSVDGGETFLNKKISNSPFTPIENIFFGDYTNIVAHNNIIRPIWTRLQDGQLSIWTELTPLEKNQVVGVEDELVAESSAFSSYPNPTSDKSYVSFKLHKTSKVSLSLYDQQGRQVAVILNDKQMEYGKYIIPISTSELAVKDGVYHAKLLIDGSSKSFKIVVLK